MGAQNYGTYVEKKRLKCLWIWKGKEQREESRLKGETNIRNEASKRIKMRT